MNDPNNNNNKITCQQNRENLSLNFVNQQILILIFSTHYFWLGLNNKSDLLYTSLQMENSIQWKKERMRGYIFIWIGKNFENFWLIFCFCLLLSLTITTTIRMKLCYFAFDFHHHHHHHQYHWNYKQIILTLTRLSRDFTNSENY